MGSTSPSVTIIGGGFGGIAAAVKLKRAGIETFTIFEKSAGVGGTWWDNVYPGAEVDVGSHLYSYSFHRHNRSRTHARQKELQQYLEDVVDAFGLRPHLRLGTEVVRAEWDEATHTYIVTLADGETFTSRVVIPRGWWPCWASDRVVSGSDYPHVEGIADPLSWADELHGLPVDVLRNVMGANMMDLFGLPEPAR